MFSSAPHVLIDSYEFQQCAQLGTYNIHVLRPCKGTEIKFGNPPDSLTQSASDGTQGGLFHGDGTFIACIRTSLIETGLFIKPLQLFVQDVRTKEALFHMALKISLKSSTFPGGVSS